jgi:hypothetical protein
LPADHADIVVPPLAVNSVPPPSGLKVMPLVPAKQPIFGLGEACGIGDTGRGTRLAVSLLDLVDHGVGGKVHDTYQPAAIFTVRRFRCGRSGGLAVRGDSKTGGAEVLAVDVMMLHSACRCWRVGGLGQSSTV